MFSEHENITIKYDQIGIEMEKKKEKSIKMLFNNFLRDLNLFITFNHLRLIYLHVVAKRSLMYVFCDSKKL